MSSFSHLAVGSEITVGQILNTSSQWLSQQGERIGLSGQFHLSAPDSRKELLLASNFVASQSYVIFVTGGLGPTSDDFTREIISEVTGTKLEWSEKAWTHLQNYLLKRQSPIRDNHKKECYFPEQSHLFYNPIGTACGFALKTKQNLWVVLPGPPREMQAMWKDQIEPFLLAHVPNLRPYTTWSTCIFGLPESAVSELLSPTLEGCPFEVGYRIHLPYIEVKIRFPQDELNQAQTWIQKVESQLQGQKAVPGYSHLIDKLWENLNLQLGEWPSALFILNPDNRAELMTRFQVESRYQFRFLNLKYEELQIKRPHLALEWNFDLDNGEVSVEIFQGSCVPLKTITCNSPLSLNHSLERRIKDLVERALFQLSSITL